VITIALSTAKGDSGQVNGHATHQGRDARAAARGDDGAGPASAFTQPAIP